MDRKQIEDLLWGIVIKHLPNVNPDAVTLDGELAKLGIDSLAFSWILVDIEDTFEIELLGSDIMKLKTLAAAADYVEQRLAR